MGKVNGLEARLEKIEKRLAKLENFMRAVLEVAPQREEIITAEKHVFSVEALKELKLKIEEEAGRPVECDGESCEKCRFDQQAFCYMRMLEAVKGWGGGSNATSKKRAK